MPGVILIKNSFTEMHFGSFHLWAKLEHSICRRLEAAAKKVGRVACIANHTFEEYLDQVTSFHGHVAPGLLAGAFMVDLALRNLPDDILFDAFCETDKCLPDAIQLLTPCTVGNGWLRILDFGRFALCLYDKRTGAGVRVYLDAHKIKAFPEIEAWFFKLKPKQLQDYALLLAEIKRAAESIYSLQHIQVLDPFLQANRIGKRSICRLCGEAYPARHGSICRACQGQAPYRLQNPKEADPRKEVYHG